MFKKVGLKFSQVYKFMRGDCWSELFRLLPIPCNCSTLLTSSLVASADRERKKANDWDSGVLHSKLQRMQGVAQTQSPLSGSVF